MVESIVRNLVSTVIPVYNRPAMLQQAVDSVLAQTHRLIEILISDDGSTDDTPLLAQQFVRDHPDIVRYVRNPNRGPGPAREAGRLLARGEFIQYLDSDDRLLPCKFEVQVAALRAHPECGIAYGITRLVDAHGEVLKSPFKWTGEARDYLFPGLLVDRWWCTHTPLYRRSVTDAIGPWCDLRYSQDWDYDARAGAMGVRLAWCDAVVSEHRHHGGDRQTGSGKWLNPADRVRFFSRLLESARRGGVGPDVPDMRHFSRWVFGHARQCGALGDAGSADAMYRIALASIGGVQWDLRGYRVLAAILGWRRAMRLTERLRQAAGRATGRWTQRQSWME